MTMPEMIKIMNIIMAILMRTLKKLSKIKNSHLKANKKCFKLSYKKLVIGKLDRTAEFSR